MTTRQRAIMIIAHRAAKAVRRHADINGIAVHTVDAKRVHDIVNETSQPGVSPDFQGFFDEIEAMSGGWKRFSNAVVRDIEDSCNVRRGWWSAR